MQQNCIYFVKNVAQTPDTTSLAICIFSTTSTCFKFRNHTDNINSLIEFEPAFYFHIGQTTFYSLDKKYIIELVWSRNEWTLLVTSPQQSSIFIVVGGKDSFAL